MSGFVDGMIGMAIVIIILGIILSKIIQNNPKVGELLAQYNPSSLYTKTPPPPPMREKMEQIYEERRRMI